MQYIALLYIKDAIPYSSKCIAQTMQYMEVIFQTQIFFLGGVTIIFFIYATFWLSEIWLFFNHRKVKGCSTFFF